jgi:hypothetical protein
MSPDEKKARARLSARAYYYANRERCLERGRAWRAANKERVKANNAAYKAEQLDHMVPDLESVPRVPRRPRPLGADQLGADGE